MAEREALWGWDLDDPPADLDDSNTRNGHEPITEPIPVVEADSEVLGQADDEPGQGDDDASGYPEEIGKAFTYAGPFIDRRPGSPMGSLTFKPARSPWYRTKPAFAVLLAVVAVAVVLSIVPLVLRSPAPGSEESTNVTPTTAVPASSTAQPTQDSVQPTLTSAPAPPPPPPPPPPPTQESAPAATRQYPAPRTAAPVEPNEPEIGVTRAPISVAPEERTPPTTAKVGDGPKRGGFW